MPLVASFFTLVEGGVEMGQRPLEASDTTVPGMGPQNPLPGAHGPDPEGSLGPVGEPCRRSAPLFAVTSQGKSKYLRTTSSKNSTPSHPTPQA